MLSRCFRARKWIALWALLCCGGVADAQEQVVFTGGGDGITWSQAANWTPPQVPGTDDDVIIPSGPNTVMVSTPQSVRSLETSRAMWISRPMEIASDLTLHDGARVTVSRTTPTAMTVRFRGGYHEVRGNGTVQMSSSSLLVSAGDTLRIGEGIEVVPGTSASGGIDTETGSTVLNYGTLRGTIHAALTVSGSGRLINRALITGTAQIASLFTNDAEVENNLLGFSMKGPWVNNGVIHGSGNVTLMGIVDLATLGNFSMAPGTTLTMWFATVTGTLTPPPGVKLQISGSTLESVVIASPVLIPDYASPVLVHGNLTLAPGAKVSMGDDTELRFEGGEQTILGSGTIITDRWPQWFSSKVRATGGCTLTLPPSVRVNVCSLEAEPGSCIVNRGTLSNTLGFVTDVHGCFRNEGVIEAVGFIGTRFRFAAPPLNLDTTSGRLTGGVWRTSGDTWMEFNGPVPVRFRSIAPETEVGISGLGFINNAGASLLGELSSNQGYLTLERNLSVTAPSGGTFVNEGALRVRAGFSLNITGGFVQTQSGTLELYCSVQKAQRSSIATP